MEDSDASGQVGGFAHEFLSAGVHTIDVDFSTDNGDVASIIEKARVDMWRIA